MIKFGTSGFRAINGEDFTKENVQKIAQALVKIIKKDKIIKPICIGFDRRYMGDFYARWIAEVFAGNNIVTKFYNHPVPSPTVMHTVMKEDLDFGIIVTASHNPYMYNGVKITTKGGKDANEELCKQIKKLANKSIRIKTADYSLSVTKGLIVEYDNIKEYIKGISKYLSKDIKEKNNIKLLFNAMHGVTNEPMNILAKKLNLKKYDIIKENTDVFFEYSVTSPDEENLETFKKEVTKGKYSLGIACDGDGDRIGIIDDQGNYISANTIIAVIYYYLIKFKEMTGDVVKSMATSTLLDKLAESLGYQCHETKVGFKYVSAKMEETNALLGGEESGGLTIKGFTPSKDSMLAVALILDCIHVMKKPLSEIIEEVKTSCDYISTYQKADIKISSKTKLMKALKKTMPKFPYKPIKIAKFKEGVKYYFEDGSFVLIRFSGTENLLRYYFEFPTEFECEKVLTAITNFIETYNK